MKIAAVVAIAAAVAGCNMRAQPPAAPTDDYDPARIELKSPPAKVTDRRNSGRFAQGNSLSAGAALAPLDPAPVKTIQLDTTHKIIEIAPGVKFSAWTFGDSVPGPTVRARVGDRIKFSMTNRSDEPVPALRLTAAPMMHSMDFHAAMVSPQDKYRSTPAPRTPWERSSTACGSRAIPTTSFAACRRCCSGRAAAPSWSS